MSETARRLGSPDKVDFTNDIMNIASSMDRALRHFCKENDLFLSSCVLTVGQIFTFTEELKAGTFTRERLIEAYRERTTRHIAVGLLDDACASFPSFAPRRKILFDAVTAHFEGMYTLSVPVLFAQIEGILRDIGTLTNKDNVKPTIKRDWDSRLLFGMTDSSIMFNAFLQNLYQGQQTRGGFNRNPVLHGTDTLYDTIDNSLILLLTLLEIRQYLWFEENTSPLI